MELTAEILQEIRALEERLWIAEFRYNLAWMENILADDFFEFGRSGRIYTRSECLDISGDTINAVIPLANFEARQLTQNVVQATYKSAMTYDGAVEYGNRSSIWLKTADGWKLKFHQGTPA